jgi:ABC-type transport system involved in multi-copper enzyme maturation permease subunit
MNWRRVALILGFDLRHGVFRVRGLLFLIPFALLWYPILRNFDRDVSAWFRGREGMVIASTLFDVDVAKALFIDNPPLLSAFFLVALASAPFFVILAAHDQVASDLGSGFFRFLAPRCTRREIFFGRFLSALLFLTCAYGVAGLAAAGVSVLTDGTGAVTAIVYTTQIVLTVFLYIAPFVAYAALVSALCSSALGALLLGMAGYVAILILMWAGNGLFSDAAPLSFLLPSGLKNHLFGVDALRSSLAAACMPIYALAYGWCGWRVFRLRNF